MTVSKSDAVKIWDSAQFYANKMRKHYHLTPDETLDLRGEIYAKAIAVTMAKVNSSNSSARVKASVSTYGSAVCKFSCYNLGRKIKRRREELKRCVSIESAFNDDGEITDRALGALEDYGAKKAFKAYLIREGVGTVFERTKKREADIIAALIMSDGQVNEAARELDPSVPKAYGVFLNRVRHSRKSFARIFFGKGGKK